jgi:hypothetical protein
MKKNQIIEAWKNGKTKEEIANLVGTPEVNKEVVQGGRVARDTAASSGYFCTISGECWGFSCNPF